MITLAELVALAALVARAPAAPPRPPPPPPAPRRRNRRTAGGAVSRLCTGIHAHPVNTPESARPVRAAARACVCSLRVRTHAAAGHASAAHCCRTLPGPPGCRPAARSCRALSWLSGAGAVLGGAWAVGREILSARVHPCGTARSAQPSMCARARWCVSRQNGRDT